MKIGLLIYNLHFGGAERVLCKWSELIAEQYEVYLYIFDGESAVGYPYRGTLSNLNLPGGGVGRIKKVINVFKRIKSLKKQLRQDGIEALISFCSTANYVAMFQKIPRAASIRLYSEYFTSRKAYRFLIKHTKTELIVQTQRLKEDVLADVGRKYANKISVIGNPVDIDLITKKLEEEPDEEFLEKIAGKKVVCFTGSFKTQKNHWNLIKSFKLVHDKIPDAVLVLIGGGGEVEDRIRKMAEESDIKDAILFTGKTDNPFMYEKKADVFVLPSLSEGIPNVLIEALVVGVPIVSTDCPSGPREILYADPDITKTAITVEEADFGILTPPFPSEQDYDIDNVLPQNQLLAQAIEKVISDTAVQERYREMCKKAIKEYDITQYAKKLLGIVERIKNR